MDTASCRQPHQQRAEQQAPGADGRQAAEHGHEQDEYGELHAAVAAQTFALLPAVLSVAKVTGSQDEPLSTELMAAGSQRMRKTPAMTPARARDLRKR